ncbi:MAG: B12-binding domain-containing protein [Methanomassiliicoccales archaeon]
MDDVKEKLVMALLASERTVAEELLSSLQDRVSPTEVAEKIISPALERIGEMWDSGDASLTQVYMASRICEDYLDTIMPTECPLRISLPKMAIASLDDHHTLGKRLVYAAIRAKGYELSDLGTMGASDMASRTKDGEYRILLVSTLMLRSALQIKELKVNLDRMGWKPILIVGGAPFNLDPTLWSEVGADVGGKDSSDALRILAHIAEGRS